MTYEDVLKQIQSAGMMGNFSQYDLDTARRDPAFGATMLSYKKDWMAAGDDAARREINQKAEALRKQYGSYYGGSDGSKYYGLGQTPGSYQSAYQSRIDEALAGLDGKSAYQDQISETLDKMHSYGDFDYGPAPTYQNRYQQQLDALLGKVQNYGPFSWSKEEDPSWSAYAKQYRREGDRATANALAQAASATGGQVSSAAMTAASQAGDYYAGKLSDKIPELYENAYQRYLSEYSKLADQLGQTQRAEQYDYAKYLDQLGQYNTDRAQSYDQWLQEYNMLGSSLGAMQGQDQTEWNRRLDALGALQGQDGTAYSRYLDQVNYQTQQDALAREQAANDRGLYQQQLDAILAAGGSPSSGMIAGSGYQDEYVRAMENYYRQQQVKTASGSGSGSRASGSSGGKKNSDGTAAGDIYRQLYSSGARSERDAYAALLALGYNTTQAGKLAGFFSEMLEEGSFDGTSEDRMDGGGELPPADGQTEKSGGNDAPKSSGGRPVKYYRDSDMTGTTNQVAVMPSGKTLIYVDGMGAMTQEQLQSAIDLGIVAETKESSGRYSYRRR